MFEILIELYCFVGIIYFGFAFWRDLKQLDIKTERDQTTREFQGFKNLIEAYRTNENSLQVQNEKLRDERDALVNTKISYEIKMPKAKKKKVARHKRTASGSPDETKSP